MRPCLGVPCGEQESMPCNTRRWPGGIYGACLARGAGSAIISWISTRPRWVTCSGTGSFRSPTRADATPSRVMPLEGYAMPCDAIHIPMVLVMHTSTESWRPSRSARSCASWVIVHDSIRAPAGSSMLVAAASMLSGVVGRSLSSPQAYSTRMSHVSTWIRWRSQAIHAPPSDGSV